MTSSPTARPPSSNRRQPNLDSPEARAFVDAAASAGSAPAAQDEAGQGHPEKPRSTGPVQSLGSRTREILRPLTLRIPESLHASLLYIAENSSKSMNQFVIDALAPAVDSQIDKIARRKELGLD